MHSLENIDAFVRAVEMASFTGAARQLHLTASAVSRRITRLEEELGVRLFHRTTRVLQLTDDGRAFYERCQRILVELGEAKEAIARTRTRPAGRLRVDAPQVLGQLVLVPALPRFGALYPDLELYLTLRDQVVDPVSEGLDVLLRIGTLGDSPLVARKLGMARMVVCAAPAYLEQHGVPQTPEDLSRHNCLGFLKEGRPTAWRLRGARGIAHLDVKGTFHVDHGAALRDAALAGLGIAWLFDFMVARELASGALVPLLEAQACDERPIHALYQKTRYQQPRVRVFLDFVAGLFSPRPKA